MKTALELLDKNGEELKVKLDISGEVIEKARLLIRSWHVRRLPHGREIISKLDGMGMHPESIAGGAVFIASVLLGERRTQREVALAFGVTEATLRNAYRRIASIADIEITV